MCKNPKTSTTTTVSEDETHNKKQLQQQQPLPKLSQFLDWNEPWILVPNGSFRGYFDNVPPTFRVGPWNQVCCLYLVVIVAWVIRECLQGYYYHHDSQSLLSANVVMIQNHWGPTTSWQWWMNAIGFTWTCYIAYRVIVSMGGFGAWICYTLQSWTLIMARYGLSVLVPFLPSLAPFNEYLRFAMLLQTTIVFVMWNFAILPAIYMTMKHGTAKQNFLKFCFTFTLVQLHICNLPLAIMNGIWGSPTRELNQVDFGVALLLALQYMIFYLLVLDRMGMHLYFIFSPRSLLALVSWTAFVGCHYVGFTLWKTILLRYGTQQQMSS